MQVIQAPMVVDDDEALLNPLGVEKLADEAKFLADHEAELMAINTYDIAKCMYATKTAIFDLHGVTVAPTPDDG